MRISAFRFARGGGRFLNVNLVKIKLVSSTGE